MIGNIKKQSTEEIDPWKNQPKDYWNYIFILFLVAAGLLLVWVFYLSTENRRPDIDKMVQYKISTLSGSELRTRLNSYEKYIDEQKLLIETLKAEELQKAKISGYTCRDKDEAYKLKNSCPTRPTIRSSLPERDAVLEAAVFKVRESYILQECMVAKSVRQARKMECLPK